MAVLMIAVLEKHCGKDSVELVSVVFTVAQSESFVLAERISQSGFPREKEWVVQVCSNHCGLFMGMHERMRKEWHWFFTLRCLLRSNDQ